MNILKVWWNKLLHIFICEPFEIEKIVQNYQLYKVSICQVCDTHYVYLWTNKYVTTWDHPYYSNTYKRYKYGEVF